MVEKKSIDTMIEQMPRLLRTLGRVHMAGTSALVKDFGPEGEKSVRQWIRRYAIWRGHELRKGHMALGLPINMESVMRYWDNASTFHLMDEWDKVGSWAPNDVRVPIVDGECKIYEPWAEADFWLWGHVYCDELHQNVVQAYHPDAVVVIPQTLSKRDSVCNFHWSMPSNARKEVDFIDPYPGQDVLKDWQMDTDEGAATCALRRTTRITAAMIHYLLEILEEFHSKESVREFDRVMELFATDRGSALRKEKDSNNWGSSPEDFFNNFDLPYSTIWEYEKKATPGGMEIQVNYCPLAETWGWMETPTSIKAYCQQACLGIAPLYDASLVGNVSQCMPQGDNNCLIEINKAD